MTLDQNPIIKKILLLLLITAFILPVSAAEPEVYYYAGNNRPAPEAEAIKKVEVDRESDNKIWIHTYIKSDGAWKIAQKEMIRVKSSEQHTISLYDGRLLIHKTKRSFAKNQNAGYQFEDRRDGIVVRSGHSKNQIPLNLDGVITEYYDNGRVKSESMYNDNQLVWNHNWLRNGDKYIDTIFYSVDTWPEYLNGEIVLKTHLNNHIVGSKYFNNDLAGTVLLGFVIMKNGELDGVQMVNESLPVIGEVAVEGFQTLPGKWKPATLDNRAVRCFMTFPVNFIQKGGMFDEVEIIGNMIFYNYR